MELQVFDPKPSRIRTIELENGNILRLEARDPYGFSHLSLEHGQLPEDLKDAMYTSWFEAERAAERYQVRRKMALSEVNIDPELKKKKK